MSNSYDYSEFNEFNRFENLDLIEPLIIKHLVESTTKHGNAFWKILHDDGIYALMDADVSQTDRLSLVEDNSGEQDTKRLSFSPFINDGISTESSFVHVFVDGIQPIDHLQANVGVTVQVFVHSKINVVASDGDPTLNPDKILVYGYYNSQDGQFYQKYNKDKDEYSELITGEAGKVYNNLLGPTYITYVWNSETATYDLGGAVYGANPNESDKNENVIILTKSRASVLMKCIIAELNGLYLDGVGYIKLKPKLSTDPPGNTYTQICNRKAFSGYEIKFVVELSGVSDSSSIGY